MNMDSRLQLVDFNGLLLCFTGDLSDQPAETFWEVIGSTSAKPEVLQPMDIDPPLHAKRQFKEHPFSSYKGS